MSGFFTILKIGALVAVLGVLAALFLVLQYFQRNFAQPVAPPTDWSEEAVTDKERAGFEAGQYEFNQARELIAVGEIEKARQKMLLIENLYPESRYAPEARRILGEINLDEILSIENMENKRIHEVAPGDGYLRIANANETTLDAIMFLNGLTEFNNLHVGDELVVMPLDFKLVIDLPRNRVELYHRDHEKKEHFFAREYPVLKQTWTGKRKGTIQARVEQKMGERDGTIYPPGRPEYRHARKILGIKVGKTLLQLRPLTGEEEADLPRTLFLAGPDMEELSMLIRVGNEVEIRTSE